MNWLIVVLSLLILPFVKADYLVVDETTGDLTPLNVFSLPDMMNYVKQQQNGNANQLIWPTVTPNTNDDITCVSAISAQYTPSTNTYSVPQWYYHSFHNIIAIVINVVDLQTFTHEMARRNIWENVGSCHDLWRKVYAEFCAPYFNTLVLKDRMQAYDSSTGIEVAMHCGDNIVCTPNNYRDLLKIPRHSDDGVGLQVF